MQKRGLLHKVFCLVVVMIYTMMATGLASAFTSRPEHGSMPCCQDNLSSQLQSTQSSIAMLADAAANKAPMHSGLDCAEQFDCTACVLGGCISYLAADVVQIVCVARRFVLATISPSHYTFYPPTASKPPRFCP